MSTFKNVVTHANYQVHVMEMIVIIRIYTPLFIHVKSSHIRNWCECVKDINYRRLALTLIFSVVSHVGEGEIVFLSRFFPYISVRAISIPVHSGLIYLHMCM